MPFPHHGFGPILNTGIGFVPKEGAKMKKLLTGLTTLALTTIIAGCSAPVLDGIAPVTSTLSSGSSNSQDGGAPSTSIDESASGSSKVKAGVILISLQSSPEYVGVKAKAKYKNRNGERELQVEAENLRVGTVVSVCVSGARAGGATANAFGNARLNLNSNAGQNVPTVSSGTRIAVHAGSSCAGALIASGQF
jgi:hypothetical protein